MRLLIITQKVAKNDPILGFFENWIREIALQVKEVKVIALAKGEYDLPRNVKVVSLLKEKGAPKILQAALFYWHAFNFLRQVDGVFIHMAPEYVKAIYPLNIFFKRPIVMWYAHIKVSPVAKWAIDHVNLVFTPSKESFELDSPKVVSTGHGINVDLFSPDTAGAIADILSLSRISKVKKIETLIEAMRVLVKEKNLNVHASIYGDPARPEDHQYLDELKELVKSHGLENHIHWRGSILNREARNIYLGHKVFVRMQGGGGFGKTELESMACGVPVVIPTKVYGNDLKEFFADMYFDEGDHVALAAKLENVLEWVPIKLERYKKAARNLVVEKHNIKNLALKIISSLESLTEKSK